MCAPASFFAFSLFRFSEIFATLKLFIVVISGLVVTFSTPTRREVLGQQAGATSGQVNSAQMSKCRCIINGNLNLTMLERLFIDTGPLKRLCFGPLLSLITLDCRQLKLSSEIAFAAMHDLAEKMHGTQFAKIVKLNNQKRV